VVGVLPGLGNVPRLADGVCDLVLSNYAISELSPALQWAYADRIILNAERGYYIVNYRHEQQSSLGGNMERVWQALEERGYKIKRQAEQPQSGGDNQVGRRPHLPNLRLCILLVLHQCENDALTDFPDRSTRRW
jgi:hypothetical protein